MSDAGPQSIAAKAHFFNSITDAVVLTMKTSFTARLLITALSVAALSAARADDPEYQTILCARRLTPNPRILSITTLARYWLKTMPTPRRDPASLTKMMTSHVAIGQAMKGHQRVRSGHRRHDARATGNLFSKAFPMFLKPLGAGAGFSADPWH
ncbi:hypothetical protein MJ585_08510 [Klebsiella pneumoniae]|nr:hypothetical protein MJ585_08510 [Klebsiella pneumoniae]